MKDFDPDRPEAAACSKAPPPGPAAAVTFDTVCSAKYAEVGDAVTAVYKRVTPAGWPVHPR